MADGVPEEDLSAALARWAADDRVARAASERSRQRWLGEQAAAGATWLGVLVELAERRARVTLGLIDRRVAGLLTGVGQDFCVVEQTNRRPALVATAAVSAIWPGDPKQPASMSGDRPPAIELSMAAALASLAEDRPPVAVWTRGQAVEGELWSVGEDVVTLRTTGEARGYAHLRLDALSVCELR